MYKLIAFIFSISISFIAHAGSGKAVSSHWMATGVSATSLWVSNITDNDLKVTIEFYDEHGTKLSPDLFYNFQNANTEVGAGKTGYVTIHADSFGYAVIKWENKGNDDDAFGLVSYAHRSSGNGEWRAAIPVNNGMPF